MLPQECFDEYEVLTNHGYRSETVTVSQLHVEKTREGKDQIDEADQKDPIHAVFRSSIHFEVMKNREW